MKTFGVKYLGSKRRLIPFILRNVAHLNITSMIDVFAGTTRVAQGFKQSGVYTVTSDLSWATTAYAHTFIANQNNHHLLQYIQELNLLSPIEGWLTTNYCGESQVTDRSDGRLFQKKNTMRADAIRARIEVLPLAPWERYTLITSLIFALDKVDNTVGVQQAYLKQWCARSYNDMKLEIPPCLIGPRGTHLEGDALVLEYPTADLAYLDPPYSPHSYATYYHVWDSIVKWDKPKTALKVNRRMDRVSGSAEFDSSFISPWNSKANALEASQKLMNRLPVKHLLLSYNDESLIAKDDLLEVCRSIGSTSVSEIDYRRNIMCQVGNAAKSSKAKKLNNKELLILITK